MASNFTSTNEGVDAHSLPVMRANLDSRLVPTPNDRSEQARLSVARARASLIDLLDHTEAESVIIADLWPGIWKWMKYIHSTCVQAEAYGEEEKFYSTYVLAVAFGALTTAQATRSLVKGTEGTLEMVVSYWSKNNEDNYPIQAAAYTAFYVVLVAMLQKSPNVLEEDILTRFANSIEGGAENAVHIAVGHVKNCLQQEVKDLRATQSHLRLITMFSPTFYSGSPSIPFCVALQNEAPLPTILDMLDLLSAKPSSRVRDEAILRCAEAISNVTLDSLGPIDLCRVLKGGLLRRMPVWAPIICSVDQSGPSTVQLILMTLAFQIIIRSVLTSIGESLEGMPIMVYRRLGIPWWELFIDAVVRGLALKQQFDEKEKSESGPGRGCHRFEVCRHRCRHGVCIVHRIDIALPSSVP